MKQVIGMVLAICLCTSFASAQFTKNSVELSLSGSMGVWTPSSQSQSYTYIFLTSDVDYYIIDGLSLEPEIGFTAVENSQPSQSILLNLSYTSRIPNSNTALFLRGGYGIGNTVLWAPFGSIPIQLSNDLNIYTINVGAGLKILLRENVALRVEGNYRQQSYKPNYGNYSSSTEQYSNFALLLGFSILL
jgi:opacity protein-like surface antigen